MPDVIPAQGKAVQPGRGGQVLVSGGPVQLRHSIAVQLAEFYDSAMELGDPEEVEAAARGCLVDLILLHSTLALEQEGELLKRLMRLSCPPHIIVFGPHDEAELVEQLTDLGASAYLPAWQAVDQLLPTVKRLRMRPRAGRSGP